jgi:hypothetical protein
VSISLASLLTSPFVLFSLPQIDHLKWDMVSLDSKLQTVHESLMTSIAEIASSVKILSGGEDSGADSTNPPATSS